MLFVRNRKPMGVTESRPKTEKPVKTFCLVLIAGFTLAIFLSGCIVHHDHPGRGHGHAHGHHKGKVKLKPKAELSVSPMIVIGD